ncbi:MULTISPECIES: hypothetical protein [Methylomonas]|uniref:hypothetical protein n=1 Tax=Methylomonas TaxID=416 RepID=UPI0012321CD0|nr:hypothetical protein [Methylomonas rhizoryzae]
MTIESSVLIPSTLPQAAVAEARAYFDQGQYASAWDALARGGDRYADNAAGVLGRGGDAADYFFQKLVQHWWDYNEPGAYETKFDAVAHDHLDNYLTQVERGYLPDTQFILNSYEQALRDNQLSASIAFDGAWAKAVPGDVFDGTWGIPFLGMELDRLTTSESHNNLTQGEAAALIGNAMTEALYDVSKQGFMASGEFVTAMIGRFGEGVGDYFRDIQNKEFLFLFDHPEILKLPVSLLVSSLFITATVIQPRRDPLTLDLDGDGLETTGIDTANPVYFDHDADGIKTSTGWVGANDGFLVLDKNGNGTIDNGRELFGDAYLKSNGQLASDGFDALSDLDSNADGVVDANDARFADLRVWRDLNQDGVSQGNELFSLSGLGIAAVNVQSTEHNQTLANGNQVADLGTFVKTDGSSGTLGEVSGNLGDVNLVQDTFHSLFADTLDTTGFETLPDVQYAGQVRRLREAATLSPALAQLLTDFAAADRTGQCVLLEPIIKAWSDTSTLADKLTILEHFNDRTFNAVPAGAAANDRTWGMAA